MLRLSTTLWTAAAATVLVLAGTASAGPERLREVPQSCKVISQQELAKSGNSASVAEMLKTLPGPVACNQSSAPSNAMNLSPFEREILNAQNAVRYKLGVPPLTWRPDLALRSTGRARDMASAHMVTHDFREGRGTIRENILRVPNSYSTSQVMDRWTREAEDFVPGTFPNVCKSGGDCSGVWHFTQIGWPTTFFVGCGQASDGQFTYYACSFDKGGNKDGQQVGTREASAEGYRLWNVEHATTQATISDGQAIDVASAPNPTTINLLGDSFVYGNIDPAWDGPNIVNVADDLSPETPLSWGADVDVVNKYVWRGFNLNDDASLQPGLWTSAYGLTASLWTMDAMGQSSDAGSGMLERTDSNADGGGIDTKVDAPVLPRAEVFKQGAYEPPNPAASADGMTVRTAPLFDIGIYAGGAWSADWFSLDDEPLCPANRIEPAVVLSYDLGAGLSAWASGHYVLPLIDEEPTEKLWFWGGGNYQRIEGSNDAAVDTKVERPNLDGLPEIFDPSAPKYNSSDCVM